MSNTIQSPKQDKAVAKNPYDKEFQQGFDRFLAKVPKEQQSYDAHWKKIRDFAGFFYENTINQFPDHDDIEREEHLLTTTDGVEIAMRFYRKSTSKSKSAIVYLHGGGRIAGDIQIVDPLVTNFVHHSGVNFLSVDYRLTPNVSGMRQIEDCYDAVLWLIEHAATIAIDPNRIAIMGDSGGGGIAAGLAIMCRVRKVKLAAQILLYPLLDDRATKPEPHIAPYVLLSYEDVLACWDAILAHEPVGGKVSEIVAPGRLTDFENLPPAFISVGFYDSFRTESIEYAENLFKAGVEVEFHLYPGVPHGFDLIAPEAEVSKRAFADYVRFMRGI